MKTRSKRVQGKNMSFRVWFEPSLRLNFSQWRRKRYTSDRKWAGLKVHELVQACPDYHWLFKFSPWCWLVACWQLSVVSFLFRALFYQHVINGNFARLSGLCDPRLSQSEALSFPNRKLFHTNTSKQELAKYIRRLFPSWRLKRIDSKQEIFFICVEERLVKVKLREQF